MNRIDKTVGGASGHKCVGKSTRGEVLAVKAKLSRADMRVLKRLRRIVLRRCRGVRKRPKASRGRKRGGAQK